MTQIQNPYSSPNATMERGEDLSGDISIIYPLIKCTGWTKFIGVMFIIIGAFSVLSIWGILFAWIPIWMGVLLIKYSNLIRKGFDENNQVTCRESIDKLRLFFKIFGIVMIVYAAIFPIAIIAAIAIPNLLAARGR